MENITLGQIKEIAVFIVALGSAIYAIYKTINSAMKKSFKPMEDKIDKLSDKVDRVDKNATMNYLVRCMDDLDRNIKLDGASRMRFIEQYEHYTNDLKGNTYIHEEYERLKKEGKL